MKASAPWLVLLVVATLAAGAPITATTQKGPVEATVSLTPAEPVIGDTVTLTVTVLGDKDVELLMPEFGQMLDRYAILDFTTSARIDDEQRTVIEQRYELQPPRSGSQSIAPIMIEFVDHRPGAKAAPDDMDAYELLTERLAFEVQSVLPTDADADLEPPLGKLPPLASATATSRLWWFVVAGLIAVAAPFAWRYWLAARRTARQRSAYDIATERLGRLLTWPRTEAAEIDAFFVELSALVRRYVEDRFELRAPELTTEQFMVAMSQSPDLAHAHQSLLHDFLRRADLVKFARFMPPAEDIDESVDAAQRILAETRYRTEVADG
jgi:hypothetical protein